MYSKLFSKIVRSTIWLEPDPTRIVWITLLACMDEDGFVDCASAGNVASVARVTLDQARDALDKFQKPDPDSSDGDNEGRRIERVPGGYVVLNAVKYRELAKRQDAKNLTRKRVSAYRARNTPVTPCNADVTPSNVLVTPSEAYTEAEAIKPTSSSSTVLSVFEHWKTVHQHPKAVLDPKRRRLIEQQLKQYTASQLCEAIDGYKLSDFHQGKNERRQVYDAIELMLRGAKQIEQGIEYKQKGRVQVWE